MTTVIKIIPLLLAIVLGTGARGEPVGVVAAQLLEAEGGLDSVARSAPHGIAIRRGIGVVKRGEPYLIDVVTQPR